MSCLHEASECPIGLPDIADERLPDGRTGCPLQVCQTLRDAAVIAPIQVVPIMVHVSEPQAAFVAMPRGRWLACKSQRPRRPRVTSVVRGTPVWKELGKNALQSVHALGISGAKSLLPIMNRGRGRAGADAARARRLEGTGLETWMRRNPDARETAERETAAVEAGARNCRRGKGAEGLESGWLNPSGCGTSRGEQDGRVKRSGWEG